jgi:hypothetical protein
LDESPVLIHRILTKLIAEFLDRCGYNFLTKFHRQPPVFSYERNTIIAGSQRSSRKDDDATEAECEREQPHSDFHDRNGSGIVSCPQPFENPDDPGFYAKYAIGRMSGCSYEHGDRAGEAKSMRGNPAKEECTDPRRADEALRGVDRVEEAGHRVGLANGLSARVWNNGRVQHRQGCIVVPNHGPHVPLQ